jgi:hypothetical protein
MPKLQEKPSDLKRKHPVLKNMKILDFFLIFGVIFALLDPDPDPHINADPDTDPDPKPWSEYVCRAHVCKPVLRIHDILVRVRFRGSMLFSSFTFKTPTKINLKKSISALKILLFEGTFTSFFKYNKSKRSYKTVGIKVFLTFFA